MAREEIVLGAQRPIKGATMRDVLEIQVDIPRQLMEDLVPAQEINMELPMAILETVLGAQSPIKRDIVNLSMEGQDPARDKGRGATMSSQVTAPDSLELDMDKPLLHPEAAGTANPVLVRPVTMRDMQEIQVGILRQLMEDQVPAQGTNMDLSMARQETVLGTQSPIKGGTVILSTKGLDQAQGKDRGATMSSQETAPDSLELDMDNPQLDMEAGNIGNPVLVRSVTVKDIQKTQVVGP